MIEMDPVRGIQENSLGMFPALIGAFVGQVGIELIKVSTNEALLVELTFQSIAVVFAVEDDFAFRPCQRHVGDHIGQQIKSSVGFPGTLPFDTHGAYRCRRNVPDGETSDKFLEDGSHRLLIAENIPEAFSTTVRRVRKI